VLFSRKLSGVPGAALGSASSWLRAGWFCGLPGLFLGKLAEMGLFTSRVLQIDTGQESGKVVFKNGLAAECSPPLRRLFRGKNISHALLICEWYGWRAQWSDEDRPVFFGQ
jgi:hypothetical protein